MKRLNHIFQKLNILIRKVLMYYFPGTATYWDLSTPCQINRGKTILGKYYLDFGAKYLYPGSITKSGIPKFTLSFKKDIFHPTVICSYALAIYSRMSHKEFTEEKLKAQFFAQADWLVENQQNLINGAGWILNFNVPEYSINEPWISALTQGEAISVLCRAYDISKNEIYISSAEKALIPFQYSVASGGLINYFDDNLILEEYPSGRANVTLNGFISAIFGLNDLYLINQNLLVKKLYDTCIESLNKIIKFFDVGYWTQYNLYEFPKVNLASIKYHKLHTEQFKALYDLTGNNSFKYYYERWNNYLRSFPNRNRALYYKLWTTFKDFIYLKFQQN